MRRVLSAAVLTLLAACASPLATREPGLRVRTDQRVYALPAGNGPGATVTFTVQNTSSSPMYLIPCGSVPTAMVERRDGLSWTVVSSGYCPLAVYTGPLELAPGETLAGTVLTERAAGTYRIRVPLADWEGSISATSPTFEVRWTDG